MLSNRNNFNRIIIISGVAIIFLCFIGYWFAPQKVISNPDQVIASLVYYPDRDHEVEVNQHELATILSKYYFQRRFGVVGSFESKEVSCYIDLIYLNYGPIHIYLGDINFMNRGSLYLDYNILDAQKLKEEVEELIKRSEVTGAK